MEINKVINGDCLDVLKTLPDNCIASIVTDPPAGINFMGKDWDDHGDIINFQNFICGVFTEAIRVLKPGGHALVWALPRTSHHTTMGLERAGFEIRDIVSHHFGSGFPKSMDISKAIDQQGSRYEFFEQVREMLNVALKQSGRSIKQINEMMGFATSGSGMAEHWFANITQQTLPTKEQWFKLKGILHFPDSFDGVFSRCISPNERPIIGKGKGAGTKGNTFPLKSEYDITTSVSPEAKQWEGWGTALKPSCEFWILCRKPLAEKSIAENVLKYGTGGINIDESRVGYSDNNKPIPQLAQGKTDIKTDNGMYGGNSYNESKTKSTIGGTLDGRFPAHLVLSHSPDCKKIGKKQVKSDGHWIAPSNGGLYELGVKNDGRDEGNKLAEDGYETVDEYVCVDGCPIKLMNEQSGKSKSTGGVGVGKLGNRIYGSYNGSTISGTSGGLGDEGGASRFFTNLEYDQFFYCPKTNTEERNRGCDELPTKQVAYGNQQTAQLKRGGKLTPNAGVGDGGVIAPSRNHHPTVKPLKLMKWLIKLITPPKGIVLDPFAGSGSTLVAAKEDNFNFIGIEKEADYVEIAQARLDATKTQMKLF